MKDTDKIALKFLAGFSASTFSLLGWVCAGNMSPNQYNWGLIIPIFLFCAYVNALAITSWMDE